MQRNSWNHRSVSESLTAQHCIDVPHGFNAKPLRGSGPAAKARFAGRFKDRAAMRAYVLMSS
jgi:hypothetical protein